MKKALIGFCNNVIVHKEKIDLWIKSFKKFCDHDIVLLVANATNEDINFCNDLNIICKYYNVDYTHQINHKRLYYIHNYLTECNYDILLSTDVFDVIFQSDPFSKLDTNNFDIFVSGEGLDICHEPWNYDNINKLFPQEINKCKNYEVINSGVIAGKRLSLINLYKRMFELCENSNNNHDIKDQAALIVMVYNNEIPKLKIFTLDDAWAMHCAVAGPTSFFDAWGFRNNIKYGIPKIKNRVVISKNNDIYDIVHQFNRIPEWHQTLKTVLYE
jgi:hypothetical protein